MMANGNDPNLIIEDDYFSDTAARCKSYGDHLNQQMSQYLSILDEICSEAIPSGAQHDALSAFAADVKSFAENIKTDSVQYRILCQRPARILLPKLITMTNSCIRDLHSTTKP